MKKNIKQVVIILGATGVLAIAAFAFEKINGSGQLSELERNTYGQGSRTESLEVQVDGEEESRSVQVQVEERRYSSEELKEVFQKAIGELDTLILGENSSVDYVDKPLNLITKIPDESIDVEWTLDNYDVLTTSGELRPENIDVGGTLVELTAVLTYGEDQAVSVMHAMLYPPADPEEELNAEIENALEETNKLTKETDTYILPASANGKQLKWIQSGSSYSVVIVLFGCVAAAYFLFIEKQNDQKARKKKQEQMMLDYPEIIDKLVLLLGAGMTVRKAWIRIASRYEAKKAQSGIRYAYEEMLYTCHELESKLTETESYENFGKRCSLAEYVKLGALLSQNLKKGTAGLTRMLALEADNAFEERKNRAKKRGEEAGTKLLLPMFLMLVIVLIIIIIPAFFSFQL